MQVLFSAIPDQEGLAVRFREKDSSWEGLAGIAFVALPSGEMLIEKSGRNVFVKARVCAQARLCCSRCLDEYLFDFDISFRHTLRPIRDKNSEAKELELMPEDLEYGYYQDDTIELDRIIEENLLLSFPMKPLCSDSCEGLCPRCGSNRNQSPCRCAGNEVDSPFGALKNLIH